MPPTELPRSRREDRAPANGVEDGVEEFPVDEVAGVVCEEVTMFELDPDVNGVVTVDVAELAVPLLAEEVPEEVEEGVEEEDVVAPIAKLDVEAKTSVILPMLTASNV